MYDQLLLGEPTGLAPGLALVFDRDGVIVDSSPIHRQAWAACARRYGVETAEAMHERTHGRRNDDIIRELYGVSLTAEEVTARGSAQQELCRQTISGRIEEVLLQSAGLLPDFRAVVDVGQVSRPKPHPEIYLRVAEQLGVSPENCVAFEDSHCGAGAAAARVNGVCTTHVNLPETDLNIDNCLSGMPEMELETWLCAQSAA